MRWRHLAVVLLVGGVLAAEAANNNRNRNQARVTKGAPAKGPSNLSFSETVNGRIGSLGTPDDQKAANQADLERRAALLQHEEDARRADTRCMDHLREQMAADTNALRRVDKDGRTLLHQAAASGFSQSVKYLLENGASTTAKDAGGATPADLALRIGRRDIADAIKQYKPATGRPGASN